MGNIEPDTMKLGFKGKADVNNVYAMIDVLNLEDVSSLKMRIKVIFLFAFTFFSDCNKVSVCIVWISHWDHYACYCIMF